MEDDERKKLGSVAVILGPGAKDNDFIGMNMSGYEKAIVTLTDGDKGPEGNRFIGGEFKRFQPEIPIKEQIVPEPVVTPHIKPEPWYKQLGIQVAAAVIGVAIVTLLIWFGIPLKN